MKRLTLLILFTLLSFQAFGQIKDFFGVPVTSPQQTAERILQKYGNSLSDIYKDSGSGFGVWYFLDAVYLDKVVPELDSPSLVRVYYDDKSVTEIQIECKVEDNNIPWLLKHLGKLFNSEYTKKSDESYSGKYWGVFKECDECIIYMHTK